MEPANLCTAVSPSFLYIFKKILHLFPPSFLVELNGLHNCLQVIKLCPQDAALMLTLGAAARHTPHTLCRHTLLNTLLFPTFCQRLQRAGEGAAL